MKIVEIFRNSRILGRNHGLAVRFRFASVPFKEDGYIDDLYDRDEDEKEGVAVFDSSVRLGFNERGLMDLSRVTNGTSSELFGEGNKYILLEPRKDLIDRLRKMLPVVSRDKALGKMLKNLLDDMDEFLKMHGAKAALLVY